MDNASSTASSPWYDLRHSLEGSFTARARGLLTTTFTLLESDGTKFGQLRLRGLSAAEFESGGHTAALTQTKRSYCMVSHGVELLTAAPRGQSIDELEISCDGRIYEARLSFLRNVAVALSGRGSGRVVQVSGSLVGRSYQVLFADHDECALPAAIFLLWQVAANRRRAYRMGNPMRREAM